MTRFIDGPARGKHLMLRRRVRFLRVVISSTGEIDALDIPEDTPKPTETIHVYEADGEGGMCHVNMGRNRGGFYALQNYKFVCTPLDAEVRDNRLWVEWCEMRAQG